MNRRRLSIIRTALIVTNCVIVSLTLSAAAVKQSRVKTRDGKVEGNRTGMVRAFLGIPYAAPPIGPLRWRPPMPAAKWPGVRDATTFGSRCMQPAIFPDMVFRDPGVSEDCLTLNVWTSAKNSKAKLPVMVWIFGGGYIAGGTSEPRQDGEFLAAKGVVVVSMNYRLGIFGFFANSELSSESGQSAAGNYGLLDQTAALNWVQQNIHAFGGDPGNVTVFGESAGSISVSAQMASPLAKGLFQRAIGESGGAFSGGGLRDKPLHEVEQDDESFVRAVLPGSSLAELRAMPAQQLLEASRKLSPQSARYRFSPDVDGYFLPESVADTFAAGRQNDVPLLAGTNRDERGVLSKTTVATFDATLTKDFGPRAAQARKAFHATSDAEAVSAASDLAADQFIAFSTWQWMEAQVATGKQPVYRYRFDLAPPAGPHNSDGIAAYHSAEIPYVFGTLNLLHDFPWRSQDYKLSQQMQQFWVNFALTGHPNGHLIDNSLPHWPVYKPATDWEVMYLGTQSAAHPDTTRSRDLFLKSESSR